MGVKPEKFQRKTFVVSGVQVTKENMQEVARWCGGLIQANPGKEGDDLEYYIKVETRDARDVKQTQARATDWVVQSGNTFKVFTNKNFKKTFESVFKKEQKKTAEQPAVERKKPDFSAMSKQLKAVEEGDPHRP